MPSEFRDPKTLPEWIEQDYFRRRRGLWRWRWWLTWGALLVCAAVLVGTAFSRRARPMYQAGPVAPAHAMFDCAACHGNHWQTARRFWQPSATSVQDDNCQKCHDGPEHSTREKKIEVQHCAGCHREHRGRVTLTRVPDSECTVCHDHIKKRSTAGEKCPFRNVTGFPGGHPPFALSEGQGDVLREGKDPGRLRFNHAAHLNPKLAEIATWEKQFRKKWESLDCNRCHVPDEAGRYMQPINYQKHCKECHPLSVQLAGDMQGAGMKRVAQEFAREPAPHRPARAVRAALLERLADLVNKQQAPAPARGGENLLAPLDPRSESPARQPWELSREERGEVERLAFVVRQLPHVENLLFEKPGGCKYCHGEPTRGADGLPEFAKPDIPNRWLPHARFGHESHRMLKCEECHGARESSETSDVLMPDIQKCADCHKPSAGARSDCVECHGYHQYGPGGKAHKGLTIPQALGK